MGQNVSFGMDSLWLPVRKLLQSISVRGYSASCFVIGLFNINK